MHEVHVADGQELHPLHISKGTGNAEPAASPREKEAVCKD